MTGSSGDALRRFFVLGYDELRRRLTRRLGSVELARDALHETWLQIENAAPIGGVRSPKLYLLRMATNAALKQLSAQKRFVTLSEAKMAVGLVDEGADPERATIARQDVETLVRALAELTPRRRNILLSSRPRGVPLREIANRASRRRLFRQAVPYGLRPRSLWQTSACCFDARFGLFQPLCRHAAIAPCCGRTCGADESADQKSGHRTRSLRPRGRRGRVRHHAAAAMIAGLRPTL